MSSGTGNGGAGRSRFRAARKERGRRGQGKENRAAAVMRHESGCGGKETGVNGTERRGSSRTSDDRRTLYTGTEAAGPERVLARSGVS
ncbi:hypothetical protein [Oxalobacter paraformigenes]|uniref:hypothetical protein n=1 Tax=Oxalobacter paraformigenes TaxID=556268 RepID=UPI0012DD4CD8|nr:hypothetical protein [Oxalobacter paraformigenes]